MKTGPHHTSRFNVNLKPNGPGLNIRWEQVVISLDDHGDKIVDKITEMVYHEKMRHIYTLLENYVLHGKPINANEPDRR